MEWGFDEYDFYKKDDIDLDNFFEENNGEPKEEQEKIILEFTKEEYDRVIEKFNEIGGSKESIIFNLLFPDE